MITINNKNINIKFKQNRIAIANDDQVAALVTQLPEKATEELVATIKQEYKNQFGADLNIADNSMIVEIWGHVLAEKFADAITKISTIKLVGKFAEKILEHSEEINIGEKGNDDNRFFWDLLAPFKPAIADFLFKKVSDA